MMQAQRNENAVGNNAPAERNPSTNVVFSSKLNDRIKQPSLHVLSEEDWKGWIQHGYVVIKAAISPEQADRTAQAIWDFEELDPSDPQTWYPAEKVALKKEYKSFNSGMVELYHHQTLWNNRQTPRVYEAFADVWGQEDLWVTIDRVNLNLPPYPGLSFDMVKHWDYDPENSSDNVQGVLSLSDQTDLSVGGFTCYPSIFRKEDFQLWKARQPEGWNWYRPDVADLAQTAVALGKGDLLIFNSRLCHGIRQNVSLDKARIAQYIAMSPAQESNEELRQWRIHAWEKREAPKGYSFYGDPRHWERDRQETARLTTLGEKLLGKRSWIS
jgi:Phytanoyl-CoA dioxygenase (PhyH)